MNHDDRLLLVIKLAFMSAMIVWLGIAVPGWIQSFHCRHNPQSFGCSEFGSQNLYQTDYDELEVEELK